MNERHVGEIHRSTTLFGERKCICVEIDANDGTRRTHQLSDQKGHVADPAAHIEYTHRLADACRAKRSFGRRPEKSPLLHEAALLEL